MNQHSSSLSTGSFQFLLKLWTFIVTFVWKPILKLLFPFKSSNNPESPRNEVNPSSDIPGPFEWPFLGDALQLNKLGGPERFLDYVERLHQIYGRIAKTKLGPQKFVFINDPALYKEVFRHEPRCPISMKLPASVELCKSFNLTRGLFFMNGEEWHKHRALLTQLLLKDTGSFMDEIFAHSLPIIQNWIHKWKQKSKENKDGSISSVEQDCYEIVIEALMAVVYGPNFREYLSSAGSNIPTLARMAIDLNTETFNLNAMPLGIAKSLNLTCWRKYEEYTLHNIRTGHKCTEFALERMLAVPENGSLEKFGLLSRMKEAANMTDEECAIHCTDFCFDVEDPLSMATLWSLLALGRNPQVQSKILEEIMDICGDKKSLRPIVYSDLEKMPYLHATIKEVFRLYPIAALILREVSEEVVVDGFKINQDYILGLSTFMSHRDPKYFPNPDSFIPERWRNKGDGTKIHGEDAYFPFGIGKRMCSGRLIAFSLLKLIIANMVQTFHIESDEVKPKLKIILYPDGEPQIRLRQRTH